MPRMRIHCSENCWNVLYKKKMSSMRVNYVESFRGLCGKNPRINSITESGVIDRCYSERQRISV
ncbi:MAG: hypothetical protein Q6356_003605 [Candidatus Wukongarchaeota archaeon]|nr:hypothetical protein [Candidatus Wukongarchaeota archaeon]